MKSEEIREFARERINALAQELGDTIGDGEARRITATIHTSDGPLEITSYTPAEQGWMRVTKLYHELQARQRELANTDDRMRAEVRHWNEAVWSLRDALADLDVIQLPDDVDED